MGGWQDALGLRIQAPVQAEQESANILLLGSSVDRAAADYFCAHGKTKPKHDAIFSKPPTGYNRARSCSMGGITLAYMFHPGAGSPPYWLHNNLKHHTGGAQEQHLLTQDIVTLDAVNYTQRVFNSNPSLIVVESSLWDLAKWWDASGKPDMNNGTYVPPHTQIQNWCSHEIPELLSWVDAAFPGSRIAFRTPPTVQYKGMGESSENIELMQQCILGHTQGSRVYGKYDLIDYHGIMDDLIKQGKDNLWLDNRHPGPEASHAYIDAMLKMLQLGPLQGPTVKQPPFQPLNMNVEIHDSEP